MTVICLMERNKYQTLLIKLILSLLSFAFGYCLLPFAAFYEEPCCIMALTENPQESQGPYFYYYDLVSEKRVSNS